MRMLLLLSLHSLPWKEWPSGAWSTAALRGSDVVDVDGLRERVRGCSVSVPVCWLLCPCFPIRASLHDHLEK